MFFLVLGEYAFKIYFHNHFYYDQELQLWAKRKVKKVNGNVF